MRDSIAARRQHRSDGFPANVRSTFGTKGFGCATTFAFEITLKTRERVNVIVRRK